jgi:hypothetical protein
MLFRIFSGCLNSFLQAKRTAALREGKNLMQVSGIMFGISDRSERIAAQRINFKHALGR